MASDKPASNAPTAGKAAPKPPSPDAVQRALVYSITALLCVTGYVIAIAMNDPCAQIADPLLRVKCKPGFAERLPGLGAYVAIGIIFAMMAFAYELRRYLRVAAPAMVGVTQIAIGIGVVAYGMSTVLAIAFVVAGLCLVLAAVGIHQGSRAAWSFAISISAVLGIVYFFGSSKIVDVGALTRAGSLLPSMAVFLPLTVLLVTTPPARRASADADAS